MKKFSLILIIFALTMAQSYAAPNYDPNNVIEIYDDSYNINLRKKLEDDFHEKYKVRETEDGVTFAYPPDGYYREVLQPFYRQQKPMEELPKTYKKQ